MAPLVVSKFPLIQSGAPKQLFCKPFVHTEMESSVYLASGFSFNRWVSVSGIKPKHMDYSSGLVIF